MEGVLACRCGKEHSDRGHDFLNYWYSYQVWSDAVLERLLDGLY